MVMPCYFLLYELYKLPPLLILLVYSDHFTLAQKTTVLKNTCSNPRVVYIWRLYIIPK